MGILDDAIRQHLDLKRQLGADESELQQLEDEAFGPPARPGDPDFPTGEEPEVAEVAEAEPEAPTTVVPVGEEQDPGGVAAGPVAGEVESPELPSDGSPETPSPTPPADEAPALVPEPEAEPEPEPEPEVEDPPVASSFTTEERAAIADQPTIIYDRSQDEAAELGELDLELDDELEEAEALEPISEESDVLEPLSEEAEALEPLSEEAEIAETEVVDGEGFESEEAAEVLDADEVEEDEDEDVLEETPEFLRDNPDDDELWFEQGEPKDFDF